ncbi:molybdopterin-dependent oxidoreductase [Pseudoroseomonas wenyumeiae]
MSQVIAFELDGAMVEAMPGETLWEAAHRLGTEIPHLCHRPEPGYRPDGNCRACMVEIEGERVLALLHAPTDTRDEGAQRQRACRARPPAGDGTAAGRPAGARGLARPELPPLGLGRPDGGDGEPLPALPRWAPDASHPAMRVNLDACIQCNLCVRACRDVQANDVIGMANRNAAAKVVFDFDDPMGASTCVACGECVQACPTGALMPAAYLDARQVRTVWPDRSVDLLCPYCGVGCQVTYQVKDDRIVYAEGRDGPANHNRLCVKGRFGFDYAQHPHRLTRPLIRRADVPKRAEDQVDPANPWTHFREASWEEALDLAATGLRRLRDTQGPKALAGFGSAKGSNEEAYLFQKLVRTGFGSNNVDHCTRLCHASSVAALMEGLNSAAVTAPFAAALEAEVIVVIGANPTVNHPVAATFIKNAVKQRGAKLVVMDPRRQQLSRHAAHHLAFRPGSDVALLNALLHTIIEEELFDRQYVDAHTEGFAELRARIRDFAPERMEAVCGIPAATLREVARLYARARSAIIFWGMGISQHVHGTDNARCLIALALITGQIGRPGTGCTRCAGRTTCKAPPMPG